MPLGTLGDVLPFVQLGRELRRRGHAVSVLTCELFAPLVEREGLEFFPLLDRAEYERIIANPRLWHPRLAGITFLREAVLPMMRRQFEFASESIAAGECDVMVAPAQSLGARVAQVNYGVPLVTVHLAPYLFRSAIKCRKVSGVALPDWFPPACKRAMFRFADWCGDQLDGRVVNKFLAELELPQANRVFWEWWNSPERIVALFPEWFAAPQTDWPQQATLAGFLPIDAEGEPPLSKEVAAYLDAGPPPIIFTAGTGMVHAGRFFTESVRAARQIGARAILLSRYREQLPVELPDDVTWADFVPLQRVLRRSAAIVHHGGIGTTIHALAAGVPQMPVPMSFDQPDNAHRVECLGVGRSVRMSDYWADQVAPQLTSLISDESIAARCREVAEWCAVADGVRIACDEIERLAPAVGAISHGANKMPERSPR